MNQNLIERHFGAIGAAIRVTEVEPPVVTTASSVRRTIRRMAVLRRSPVVLDVQTVREKRKLKEIFTLHIERGVDVNVVQIDPDLRHLLLNVNDGKQKSKFLCGHDERHWFVAGVNNSVTTVRSAMESLQPPAVRAKTNGLRSKERLTRKNSAFIRQGEWFFLPANITLPPDAVILRNEPLRRNARSKPHVVDEMYSHGGQMVYLCAHFPVGALPEHWAEHRATEEGRNCFRARTAVRDAIVYVRGRVRHSDHKTVELKGWHRVQMNDERVDPGRIAFLD